jgi:hypothetical protein
MSGLPGGSVSHRLRAETSHNGSGERAEPVR